jgi:hypothetical protein
LEKPLDNKYVAHDKWITSSIIYALLIMAIGGYFNYTVAYDPSPAQSITFGMILLWTALYLPVLMLPMLANWEIKEFGFSINPFLFLASLFFLAFCGGQGTILNWSAGLFEAFARTGEEVFFRGFLFVLLLKIFEGKQHPWIWSVIGSSLAFTMIHTQTFQLVSSGQLGSGPVLSLIVQRFLNLFITAVALASIRYGTRSILPSSIAHSMLSAGWITVPFVLLIYAGLTYWAYSRKEQILFGFNKLNPVT